MIHTVCTSKEEQSTFSGEVKEGFLEELECESDTLSHRGATAIDSLLWLLR